MFDSEDDEDSGDTGRRQDGGANPIRRIVDEISACMTDINDQREALRALGIPLRTTRTIVELGVQNQTEKQASVMDSALAMSATSEGSFAIDRKELLSRIDAIVQLERALTHTRTVARQQGYDAQILSFLTQIIEQNPGDGGARLVNTFVEYAQACGIAVNSVDTEQSRPQVATDSVLPMVERTPSAGDGSNVRRMLKDAVLGLVIGLGILWLVA